MEQFGGQLLCTVRKDDEIIGFVGIDSTIAGRCCGGLRMLPDVDAEEIAKLARAMTLKFGYLGLPHGGAKAAVLGDPEDDPGERRRRLEQFGQAIAPMLQRRLYSPHPDMGTGNSDICTLMESVGIRPKPREPQDGRSGYYTALTVMAGIREGCRHLGLDFSKAAVAIEGFGNVGRSLGCLLNEAGVRVVAVSTSRGGLYRAEGLPIEQLCHLSVEKGSRFVEDFNGADHVPCGDILELPVDVLCPCARHASISGRNASRIHARLISAGANNPLTPEAEDLLESKDVLCLPDFVTNCGGVLGGTMAFAGHRREAIERIVAEHFGKRIGRLLADASAKNVRARQLAVREARERFARMKQAATHQGLAGRAFELGINLHRRGWLPPRLTASLSLSYFRDRAGGPANPGL